jgi:putative ATP-dependent endonuclease of the OLD family
LKISKVHVQNYRNLKDLEIKLNRVVIFIGENNSGKSNLLKAMTLPFLNDEIGNLSKNLGWQDINNSARERYLTFISNNIEEIRNGSLENEKFIEIIPFVKVEVTFQPDGADEYYVHRWVNSIDGESPHYAIRYQFYVENPKELLEHVEKILKQETDPIENLKMNLLPIEFYKYSITNPSTGEQVTYNELTNFKYNSLAAERDEFSNKASQLGSRALVNLLHSKLSEDDKIRVEKSYGHFFSELKEISNLEGIFNWQRHSGLENAKDFFEDITLMPNMPSMTSLLNNVRLGFRDEYLNTQGLGYRNLIYLFVMINSLEVSQDRALNLLTIEEPEAHLCVSNELMLASFINSIVSSSKKLQIFISTHSPVFINKLEMENVTVVSGGSAFSLKSEMEEEQLDYLAKKPNLDFLKFLFSRRCILVEGPTEEMLIKSYISTQTNSLNDIEVISLHKGFTKMIDIWLRVNLGLTHRLGIIRDFDNQQIAKETHEKYNSYDNIYVATTEEYTLEPEIVNTGSNFEKLKKYFTDKRGWENIDTPELLSNKWREAKTDTMLKFCRDISGSELVGIELPQHISRVLTFLLTGEKQ